MAPGGRGWSASTVRLSTDGGAATIEAMSELARIDPLAHVAEGASIGPGTTVWQFVVVLDDWIDGTGTSPDRYNDLGVHKYDLFGAFRRLQNHLRGTPTANPKLVSYLAAGSIKGLRPLRYEKRIARNRFIFLSLFFALILWGIIMAFIRSH